jgi:ABC-type sugar transport system permease subunit
MSPLLNTGDHIDRVLAWLDDRMAGRVVGRHHGARAALVLLFPALLIIGVFGLAPIAATVVMSLYDLRYGDGAFSGLANYSEAMGSSAFLNSVRVTAYYLVGVVPTSIVLGFVIAWSLTKITRGRALFRTIYFLPYITSAYAAALVWRALLNPQGGLVNELLGVLGIPAQQWLLEPRGVLHLMTDGAVAADFGPSLALCCVIAFDIWHGLGFVVVILLAGLSSIPGELEDAARVDGAGVIQVVRHVTLPLLTPTLYFLLLVGTIKGFQAFNSFYALTTSGGNTLGTTENLVIYLFSNFYDNGRWGYGAAIATLLLVAIMGLSLIQARFSRRWVHYQ